MINLLKKLFGLGPSTDYSQLIKNGAVIVDVRTTGEYAGGHISGSLNIPVEQLKSKLSRLKDKDKPIITCCASGMRSSTAKMILKSSGYKEVYNGGPWFSLQNKIR